MKHKVRVRDGFSDRNSLSTIPKIIQFDDFSAETRIVLFNSLKYIVDRGIKVYWYDKELLAKFIVEDVFNEVYTDKFHMSFSAVMDDLLETFKDDEYHSLLTVIEYVCNLIYQPKDDFYKTGLNEDQYFDPREEMNKSFEDEFVGYRFLNDKITRITNKEEIESIKQSFDTPYEYVNKSILKSLSMLSETGNKDYKNAIKEAVMAVEQLFNILLETEGLVLSNAVEQLYERVDMNEHLKNSIKELYRFACDANGIRHGNNKKDEKITFADAKYVLLSCSSLINYLVLKYKDGASKDKQSPLDLL